MENRNPDPGATSHIHDDVLITKPFGADISRHTSSQSVALYHSYLTVMLDRCAF